MEDLELNLGDTVRKLNVYSLVERIDIFLVNLGWRGPKQIFLLQFLVTGQNIYLTLLISSLFLLGKLTYVDLNLHATPIRLCHTSIGVQLQLYECDAELKSYRRV